MSDLIVGALQGSIDGINAAARWIGLQEKSQNIDVKAIERQVADQVRMSASGPGRFIIRLAGLSGAAAVSMAAYGEHGKITFGRLCQHSN